MDIYARLSDISYHLASSFIDALLVSDALADVLN